MPTRPTQRRLPLAAETFPTAPVPAQAPKASHASRNAEAARVILADVARYGGEGALAVEWARAFVKQEAANAA